MKRVFGSWRQSLTNLYGFSHAFQEVWELILIFDFLCSFAGFSQSSCTAYSSFRLCLSMYKHLISSYSAVCFSRCQINCSSLAIVLDNIWGIYIWEPCTLCLLHLNYPWEKKVKNKIECIFRGNYSSKLYNLNIEETSSVFQ